MTLSLLPPRKSEKYNIVYKLVYKYLKGNSRVVFVFLYDREASMVDERKALSKRCSVKTSIRFLFSFYVILLNTFNSTSCCIILEQIEYLLTC